MAVYVDDMYKYSIGQFGRMKMSHMIADTREELLKMADSIGVNRKWVQHENSALEHFDISKSKRKLAVDNGAIEITWREFGKMCEDRSNDLIEMMTYYTKKINELIGKEITDYGTEKDTN